MTIFGTLLAILLVGCLDPTEAFVEISTDAACIDVEDTGITAGLIGEIETKAYDTSTSLCKEGGEEDSEIGSIVITPPDGEKEAPFAFKVVTSLGAPVMESCVGPNYGPGCIVARRAMRFVPQNPFHVPVHMSEACAGVRCPETQTCVDGSCRSATLNPADCEKPGGCELLPEAVPAWEKIEGGPGVEMVRSIALAESGMLAVTGNFDGEMDLGFGPLTSRGGQDIFIATYSKGGHLRWSASFGGKGKDDYAVVALGAEGDIYLLAGFEETVDFGGGDIKSAGGPDVALVKFTSYGKLEWAIPLGGSLGDTPGRVAVGADGNVYVVGSFSGEASFGGKKLTSAGFSDAFVASFTPTGDLRWAKAMGGPKNDGANSLALDASANVYVAGYFEETMQTGDGVALEVVGTSDVFFASFNANGGERWVKSFGASATDRPYDLAARGDRVVMTGSIANDVTIDGVVIDAESASGFVASFELSGKLAWAKTFGGKGTDLGDSVAIAEDGSIVLSGGVYEGSAFGSAPARLGGLKNPFITVLERDGAVRWSQMFSSSFYGSMTSVTAAPDGFVLAGGWFTKDLELGSGVVTSGGAEDMVLLRLAPPSP
jgi:hypothetical protein